MAYRKLQFKNVGTSRSTEVIQEGELAVDETSNKLYLGDGSTTGGVAINSGISYTVVSDTYTASAGEYVWPKKLGAMDINLPASPSAGDTVVVATSNTYAGLNVTVKDSGGSTISTLGSPEINYFVYDGSAWKQITV